jgi:hypothetical protein
MCFEVEGCVGIYGNLGLNKRLLQRADFATDLDAAVDLWSKA